MMWMDSLSPLFTGRTSNAALETRPLNLELWRPMRLAGSALKILVRSRVGRRMKEEVFLTHSQRRSGEAMATGLGRFQPHTGTAGVAGVAGVAGALAFGAGAGAVALGAGAVALGSGGGGGSSGASCSSASQASQAPDSPASTSSSGTGASGKYSSMSSRRLGLASSILSAAPFTKITPLRAWGAMARLPCLSPRSRSKGVRTRTTPLGQKALSMWMSNSSSSAIAPSRAQATLVYRRQARALN
mmetsp:Transcript_35366/g.75333  ORF Transcript_35366/g.75333 Transcript_35366/m.75333 type:complete len:244 (+) Transcript_35366:447-1178(+)